MNTPVAFLVFNRPEQTCRVFERIRQAQPRQLLVVCDGPRPHVPTDGERVEEVHQIIARGVDWPCEVLTNYAPANMGCGERVASGLDWVFSLVEEAIILEDDCLPDASFFTFCEAMLERYRHDERVMHINGTNFVASYVRPDSSYFFSKYVWVWGWATWRRAWCHYDPTMATWETRAKALDDSFDTRKEKAFWLSVFNEARADWSKANTWDYQWMYSCWTRDGLSLFPSVNLVENLGFGVDATHTTSDFPHLRLATANLKTLNPPRQASRSRVRDSLMLSAYIGDPLHWRTNLTARLRVFQQQLLKLLSRVWTK